MPEKSTFLGHLKIRTVLPITLLVLAVLILVPIPVLLLDILTALNLIFAAVILITAFCVKNKAQFSLCPALLLATTLFNAAINISAARLILSLGADFDGRLILFTASWFTGEAGEMAHLTGGAVIFVLILAVHTMLITKGLYRTAEEADALTLEDMPAKQQAIESEHSSGVIGREEHDARKEALQHEAHFYAAMNRAVKLISGNELFRILIIAVIIFGGAFVSGLFYGEAAAEEIIDAAKIYIPLVIGNGLLSIIPAFFVSAAALIIITRAVFGRTITK